MIALSALALTLCLAPTSLPRMTSGPSEGPPPILQPKSYRSPSGRYELYVDPSRRNGGGAGSYRMSRDGELVWAQQLPVTLWEAGVTDDGLTAGFAYSNGYRDHRADGSLHLMILGSGGQPILDEALKRESSRYMHAPPAPRASQLVLQESSDRMHVRVLLDEMPAPVVWRTYRLSTGERLEDWAPRLLIRTGADLEYPVAVRPVTPTGLTLVHWWTVAYSAGAGAVFTLVDDAGATVWSLARPDDYKVDGDRKASNRLEARVRSDGAILGSGPGSTFELWFPKDQTRVRFGVEREGESWSVQDLERTPYDPDESKDSPALESLRLEPITVTPLVPAELRPESPIRQVRSLGFTDEGRIEFVRGHGEDCTHVELDEAGQVVAERPLPNLQPESGTVSWFDGPGDTWFAAVRDWNQDGEYVLQRVNRSSGEHHVVLSFACPKIDALVATRDGGFVLLGYTGRSSRRACLISADAQDAVRWRRNEMPGSHEHEDQLFATKDLAITRDGYVVVLSTVRDSLQVFSAGGDFVRYIDLEEAWGHDPRYPARVVADGRGGVCIEDDGKLWRMSLEGELLESWKPPSPRESDYPLRGGRFDGYGNLWRVKGELITSTRSDGSQGPQFGSPPTLASIEDPGNAWITREGHVCILDERSSVWHLFDSSGEPHLVLALPEPLVAHDGVDVHPSLGPDGHWFVPLHDRDDERGHYEFSETGEPLREVRLGAVMVQFRGQAPGAWSSDEYDDQLRLVREGEMPLELRRRPDRLWFRSIGEYQLSADGRTLAVLDTPRFFTSDRGNALCLYDGEGDGRATIELPGQGQPRYHRVSVCERWAAIADFGTGVTLADLDTHQLFQFQLDLESEGHTWRWGFSPDGSQLWGVDVQALELHRFALPHE